MTIAAQTVIDEVEAILQDSSNDRWSAANHLRNLNDAQREIALKQPGAYVLTTAFQLTTGTKQAIPTGGIVLIDITRNMGTDGSTVGNAISRITKEELSRWKPAWHTDTASATVTHFIYDPQNPKVFYVYPQQPTSSQGYVEGVYAGTPSDILISANLTLDDIYKNAIVLFMLYKAYMFDSDQSQASATLAEAYRRQFLEFFGGGG